MKTEIAIPPILTESTPRVLNFYDFWLIIIVQKRAAKAHSEITSLVVVSHCLRNRWLARNILMHLQIRLLKEMNDHSGKKATPTESPSTNANPIQTNFLTVTELKKSGLAGHERRLALQGVRPSSSLQSIIASLIKRSLIKDSFLRRVAR